MRRARRKAVFVKSHDKYASTQTSREAVDKDDNMASRDNETEEFITLPWYQTREPWLKDNLVTATSILQDKTVQECLPLLNGINDPSRNPFDFDERGVPALNREDHIEFARDALDEYPPPFVGVDASRPWLVYWSLLSLYLLGEDVRSYQQSVVKTFYPLQNATGGFGGGQGHISHLAATYATLLTIALVGGDEAYSLVDRQAMWQWLGRLKQSDGGFRVCEDGEEDVRGAYCALVAVSLLDLPWELPLDCPARKSGMETFGDGLGNYLSRCQTYEGGISSAPGTEAHGSYAFCVLACLCLLDAPDRAIRQYLDVEALLSWLSARQYAPEGGLAGRTNKVVDGCYSHWIGGCWPLVQAAVFGPLREDQDHGLQMTGNLFSTDGLSMYILSCCQNPGGGLRDKPSKRPDAYHTCYNLVGLSVTEHLQFFTNPEDSNLFSTIPTWISSEQNDEERKVLNDDSHGNTGVKPLHPVYVIPSQAAVAMRNWSQQHKVEYQS